MYEMKDLIACEFSGIVRDAFIKKGHDAWSCDLLPSEGNGNHIQANVMDIDMTPYDLVIAHPPCTYLSSSGARWWETKQVEQRKAIYFFLWLVNLPNQMVAVENPIGLMSTLYRKPDQIIQPWQFGHGETKATCLWVKNLPLLEPTNIVNGRKPRVHHEPPSKERWKNRSRTYQGIANAMAEQWGVVL